MKLCWLEKPICWSNYHDTALPMTKLKDILNEVALVIKLRVPQKYFLHIYGFKEIQRSLQAVMGEGLSGRGGDSCNMGIRTAQTDKEKSCASYSGRLDCDVEGPFQGHALSDPSLAGLEIRQYSINFTTEHF